MQRVIWSCAKNKLGLHTASPSGPAAGAAGAAPGSAASAAAARRAANLAEAESEGRGPQKGAFLGASGC